VSAWSYERVLAWLDGLLNYERVAIPYAQIKLERIRALLRRLGDPQDRLRTVLVAGTKGKGSTGAMLAAVLQAHGQRVGFYSKPHLWDYRERIRVNDELVPQEALADLVERVAPAVEAGDGDPWGKPTYFEVSVALALLHFLEARVDRAVFEVGIGGRLDATNVCWPEVSVITPISHDHTDILGQTLREIASEKAGIVRPGGTVVLAPQQPEAEEVLVATCRELSARTVWVGEDVRLEVEHSGLGGVRFSVTTPGQRYEGLHVPLLGRHQATNAAVAVAAAECWAAVDGWSLAPDAVREGLARVRWPARQELVGTRPWALVDVAHNPASMEALRQTVGELFSGRRVVLVLGMVRGHDARETISRILSVADEVVVTTPRHVRPVPAGELAALVAASHPRVHVVEDCEQAVRWAFGRCAPEDVLVVAGSFFVAGPARVVLAGRAGASVS
jgi:dihydrofolate synthase/folylpolyglutamate synthase